MQETSVTPLNEQQKLSSLKKVGLVDTLNRLPILDFLDIEFALEIPVEDLPSLSLEQAQSSARLLQYLENVAGGSGITKLLETLKRKEINPFPNVPRTSTEQHDSLYLKIEIEVDSEILTRERLFDISVKFQEVSRGLSVHKPDVRSAQAETSRIWIELRGPLSALEEVKTQIDSGDIDEVAGLSVLRVSDVETKPTVEGPCLAYADLRHADLRYADLRYADLRYADLHQTDFRRTNLHRANLRDARNLRSATLCFANLSYADLGDSDLSGIDLSFAELRFANLHSADLHSTNFSHADLHLANLRGTRNLRYAIFHGADLHDIRLHRADLVGSCLSYTDFRLADLRETNLVSADLTGANLSDANLFCADLAGANLCRANLSGSMLFCANLRRANLSGANLTGADLREAHLRSTRVKKAIFGNNMGLSEDDKADLRRRGAIFRDLQLPEDSYERPVA